ncbi:Uncharacterised protein [uncultured archaeon]|nr:Uncharacterised protein [uncultured archaeon]
MSLRYTLAKVLNYTVYGNDKDFVNELQKNNGDVMLKIVHERIPEGCGHYDAPVAHRFVLVAKSGIKPYVARKYTDANESAGAEAAHAKRIVSDIKTTFSEFRFSNEISVIIGKSC